MKVIINVHKESQYAIYNFLTFEVIELLRYGAIAININGVTTDFFWREVVIVNLQEEIQHAYDSFNFDGSKSLEYSYLLTYKDFKGIKFEPVYHCPA